jgi:hypothetical protein
MAEKSNKLPQFQREGEEMFRIKMRNDCFTTNLYFPECAMC